MKKIILVFVVTGLLLTGANAFAADGDLIVDGNLGVGTGTTSPDSNVVVNANTAAPQTALTGTTLHLSGQDFTGQRLLIDGYGNWSNITFRRADNIATDPHPVASGVSLGAITAFGYAGNGYSSSGRATISFTTAEQWSSNAQGTYITFSTTTKGATSASERLRIADNGYVGIGTTSPSHQLELSTDSAAKLLTATWSTTSDARLKKNIQPYTKGLDEILQINPVTYQYNGKGGIGHHIVTTTDPATGQNVETDVVDTELLSKTGVGVIAQDIQAVVAETVGSHKGKIDKSDAVESDILDFNPHALTFIMINAIKDLKSQIDSLNKQIADLQMKVK